MNTVNSRRSSSNGMFLTFAILGIVIVSLLVPEFRKAVVWGVQEALKSTFNPPELYQNPHGDVVKIKESGKVYLPVNQDFHNILSRIKHGRYEIVHVGLDGK